MSTLSKIKKARNRQSVLTEREDISRSEVKNKHKQLERLWSSFIKNVRKLGYIPKPSEELNFRLETLSKHDALARISLKTPSLREMEMKGRYDSNQYGRRTYEDDYGRKNIEEPSDNPYQF